MSTAPETPRRRLVRLVVLPAVIFVAVSGTAFALAKAHPAKPSVPTSSGPVQLGDPYQGELVFEETCASCHGAGGKGGTIGPKLAGVSITLAQAKAKIDAGGGVMPAGLVSGEDERDVLAYLETILAP